jgi:Tfp pilus assembly protein FimT
MRAPTLDSLGRRGTTLLELILVMSLLGLVAVTALPALRGTQDRLAAEGAAAVTVRAMADTRHHAVRRSTRTALFMDSVTRHLTIVAGPETVTVHDLAALFGVSLSVTRDSIAWSPTGLGFGAANARVVLSRGQAADTVTVSRLGRIRR